MDVVTIMMGINDWAAARNNSTDGVYYHLGDINSTETNCIYGAMRMWCDKIEELRNTESCANTRFYFMTPIITSWNSSVTSTRNWDQSKTNVHGFTLRDLCHAIIDVATDYDIPVIDLNLCSGIYYNSATDENVSLYGGDGVHINEAGHSMVTDAIIRALASDEEFKVYTPHIEIGALSTLGVWAKNFYDRQYYRTPRYMQVTDSNVEIKVKDDCDVRVCQYDADFKFIKIIDFTQVMASEGKTFKLDASCEYIRLVFRKDSSLPQFEKPEVYVKNVEAKEYFEPRPADDGYQKILAHVEVDGEILPDYGVVCLPETYSNVGEPTRLIIFCHGAAVNYPSSVSRFVASDINPEYWLKEGYAIMDIEGNPFDNTNEHFYIPQAIQCYKAAYDWVTTTYNIRTDGVFLGGRSMGGGMCFEILRSDIPVIAACPVVPACNQLWYWNYADAGRKAFCSEKMGFTGTQPTWTSSKKLTDAEYDYLYANFDKMLSCSPFWSGIENLPSKDELFSVGRVSANTAYDEAEANLFSTLKFRAKAPVKIFTCYEDNTVPYQRNAQLMYNMMVNAGMECELSLVHTDASTPHRYEQQDSNANITVTTRFGETMSAPWVYVDMVKFWRKYE
jgi:acetyl esterase/lipase/lysophospholipase L1-like esterase